MVPGIDSSAGEYAIPAIHDKPHAVTGDASTVSPFST
jgi:hypothetical protein